MRARLPIPEHGLAFTTPFGTGDESHNLRRDFRPVTAAAGLGARWMPMELRTSFVSMISYAGLVQLYLQTSDCSAPD